MLTKADALRFGIVDYAKKVEGGDKMRSIRLLLLVSVLAVFGLIMTSGVAMAANPSVVSVTANVPSSLDLTIASGSPVAFGSVVPGDVSNQSLVLNVKSNKPWNLAVKTGGLLKNVGGSTIASSQLLYSGGDKTDTQFTVTDVNLYTANQAKTGSTDVTVAYKLTVLWTDDPGAYTASHTYTLAQF